MKKIIISIVFGALLFSSAAMAASKFNFNESTGVNIIAKGTGHQDLTFFSPNATPLQIIGKLINILITLLGVIFMCYTFYAGYLWMMAQGESKDIDKATHILKNSIIGLLVILFAYAITSFMFSSFLDAGSKSTSGGTPTGTSAATGATGAKTTEIK